MTNSSQLSFLCTFKSEYKMEQYLTTIKNSNILKMFTQLQFQISTHKLSIERGRHENIPPANKELVKSATGEIEDKFHLK